MKKQHGNAVMIFALMLPFLIGIFVLGTDGARALQVKARLGDALASACLAIVGSSDNQHIVMFYIADYLPGEKVKSATVSSSSAGMTIRASVVRDTWFTGGILSFGHAVTINSSIDCP